MKIKSLLFSFLALPLVLAGCGAPKEPAARADYLVERAADKLNLNEAQQQQLRGIVIDFQSTRDQLRGDFSTTFEDLEGLLGQDKISPQELEAIYDKRRAGIDTVYNKFAPRLIALHATLTAEQKTELQSLLKKGKGRWGKGRKGGRGRGGHDHDDDDYDSDDDKS